MRAGGSSTRRELERKRRPLPPGLRAARRRTGGAGHRPASEGTPPKGYCELVSCGCWRAGSSSWRSSGRSATFDHPEDAKKNGMTAAESRVLGDPGPQAGCGVSWRHMEQVLDRYQQPYDPDCPVVCMDEQPVATDVPGNATAGGRDRHATAPRGRTQYERAGTASVFLFSSPPGGAGPAYS